jgi:hypothetical protein
LRWSLGGCFWRVERALIFPGQPSTQKAFQNLQNLLQQSGDPAQTLLPLKRHLEVGVPGHPIRDVDTLRSLLLWPDFLVSPVYRSIFGVRRTGRSSHSMLSTCSLSQLMDHHDSLLCTLIAGLQGCNDVTDLLEFF